MDTYRRVAERAQKFRVRITPRRRNSPRSPTSSSRDCSFSITARTSAVARACPICEDVALNEVRRPIPAASSLPTISMCFEDAFGPLREREQCPRFWDARGFFGTKTRDIGLMRHILLARVVRRAARARTWLRQGTYRTGTGRGRIGDHRRRHLRWDIERCLRDDTHHHGTQRRQVIRCDPMQTQLSPAMCITASSAVPEGVRKRIRCFRVVPRTALTFTRGSPHHYRSTPYAERGFCESCGTPLTFRYPRFRRSPADAYTSVGSLMG